MKNKKIRKNTISPTTYLNKYLYDDYPYAFNTTIKKKNFLLKILIYLLRHNMIV